MWAKCTFWADIVGILVDGDGYETAVAPVGLFRVYGSLTGHTVQILAYHRSTWIRSDFNLFVG
jgi:hypothetical protein